MFPPLLSGPPRVQSLPLLVSIGHAMPPRPVGRRCQDSARQRPRQEINCFNSLVLSNPFSDFSVVANSHTKRFTNIVLDLTYLGTECESVVPSLASAQQLVVTLRSFKTDSFRLGQCLIIARTGSQVCAVTAVKHYFQLAAPSSGPLFSFQSSRLLTRSAVIFLLRDIVGLAGLPFHSLKGHTFPIGAASTAAAVGLPDWLIKIMDRWSSDCYQLYIRTTP